MVVLAFCRFTKKRETGMSDEKVAEYFRSPFMPLQSGGRGNVDAALRMAHAAEFAAAQLGTIARAAEKIEAHLAKIAAKHPEEVSPADLVVASHAKPDDS